jgi:ATP-dependent helicase/nuclease subunit A
MPKPLTPLPRLEDTQLDASNPGDDVWLSASAGTGKTHVLAARVLRLLLTGANPEVILCLTFTKAGAAEMAERVHQRLAAWVRMPDKDLRKELFALGEPNTDADIARARRLFATVLEARGGGLRIQTIHSFCQTLLAGFPAEAGLSPGFRALEGREEASLAQRVLNDMLVVAERGGEMGVIDKARVLSHRVGEEKARAFLRTCARAPDAMAGLPAGDGVGPFLRRAMCDGIDDVGGWIYRRRGPDRHRGSQPELGHQDGFGTGRCRL